MIQKTGLSFLTVITWIIILTVFRIVRLWFTGKDNYIVCFQLTGKRMSYGRIMD